MKKSLASLTQQVQTLSETIAAHEQRFSLMRRSIPEFTVGQYNILAGYLGDNRQPWFLYGIDLSPERRSAITDKVQTCAVTTHARTRSITPPCSELTMRQPHPPTLASFMSATPREIFVTSAGPSTWRAS